MNKKRCRTVVLLCLINILPITSGTLIENSKTYLSLDKQGLNSEDKFFADEPLPVIVYGMHDSDEAFTRVKEWGATHVHQYGMGRSIERDQSFFDRADEYEMKVMGDLRAMYWLKENRNIELFREYTTHFKEHPALGFWYLSDEPDNKGFKPYKLKPLYEILQNKTPEIAVANAHAWSENWYKYGKVQDILMYDNYPIYAEKFPDGDLKAWTNFTENAIKQGGKDDDLVIPVLQIFNWKAFADKGQNKYRGYSVEKLRYPNFNELRYMFFASIALGASGISLFSYARSMMVNPEWSNRLLTPVIKEAKKFAKQIDDINDKKKLSKNSKFIFSSWSKVDDVFLVFVNRTSNSRSIDFMMNEKVENVEEYKPWGQTRETVNLTSTGRQIFIDKIEPWEVVIFKKAIP